MRTVIIPARMDQLENVREFADEVFAGIRVSKEERMEVELAVEEVFVNIVKYACLPKEGVIEVSYEYHQEEAEMMIQFEDGGRPFNPLERKEPDIAADVTERSPGGLGIYMLKKVMSHVEYEYSGGCNRLRLWKKFLGWKGEDGNGVRDGGNISER